MKSRSLHDKTKNCVIIFSCDVRSFMKYYLPLGFSSRNITKNAETHPPPMRDVIIKNADFGLEFEKNYCHFRNQHP